MTKTTYTYINDEHRDIVEQALADLHGPRLGAFAATHRHIVDAPYIDLFGTRYSRLREDGRPLEVWYKTSDDWLDITAREQLRWDIEQRKEEVRAAEQRQLIEEAKRLMATRATKDS